MTMHSSDNSTSTSNPSGKGIADPYLIIELIIGRLPGFFIAMHPIGVRRCWNVSLAIDALVSLTLGKFDYADPN